MSPAPRPRGRAGGLLAAAAAAALGVAALAATPPALAGGTAAPAGGSPAQAGAAAPGSSWTVYHGDAAGSGVASSPASVGLSRRAWTSPQLDADLYGEPLVSGGQVYVATERDTVYALSAATGAVTWSRHLATPVPASMLPCGDIGPTVGITGTPVIDPARGELFVVADELIGGKPAHVLTGLAIADGAVRMHTRVDPPGADPAALLQRTGLNLAGGRVVFGFGGNDGDCPSYRGRVVSVPEAGGAPAVFTVDGQPGQSQGAVWMGGGAPAVDGAGHVWVTAGNGSVYKTSRGYDDSDSVLELSPGMRLLHFYAPGTWASDNSTDQDMSTAPALLRDGHVVAAGKQRKVYLLDGARPGGIGGQQAIAPGMCADDIDGGMAVTGRTVYLPCLAGPVAIRISASPPGVTRLWAAAAGGGPPIVAAGLVWTISRSGILYGLDPANGTVRQQAAIGAPANHFPTPAAAGGLLLAASAQQVIAFRAGAPGTSAARPTATAAPGGLGAAPATGGGLPGAAIAGLVAGGVLVLGGAGWAVWRRRVTARAPGA
jgi:outer membrane protein assembly factor BamB